MAGLLRIAELEQVGAVLTTIERLQHVSGFSAVVDVALVFDELDLRASAECTDCRCWEWIRSRRLCLSLDVASAPATANAPPGNDFV